MTIAIPTAPTPTLDGFVNRLRLDLFDAGQRVDDEPRWTDGDLVRAVDRAVDRYSTVAPLLRQTVIPSRNGSRLYVLPDDAWWVDAVEYPFGLWPRWYQAVEERVSPFVEAPSAGLGRVDLESGGSLSPGLYYWLVSFVTPGGETMAAPLASATAVAGEQARISRIPLGPYGVTGRNVYRTGADGFVFGLVAALDDNTITGIVDGLPDSALLTAPRPPLVNSTAGVRQFELQISDAKLPSKSNDAGQDQHYGWIGLRFAAKHELDANGTTIPERHHDVLALGAAMYAIMAYLVPTADNFEFVDGQFRDRVDDTKAPGAWLSIGKNLEARFEARLAEIKNEENSGVAAIGSWGDKPLRWDRL